MPCWTVTTYSVSDKLDKINVQRFTTVLEQQSWYVTTTDAGITAYSGAGDTLTWAKNGSLTVVSAKSEAQIRKIISGVKQAYSAATVREGMKRFGWKVTETKADGKVRLSARR